HAPGRRGLLDLGDQAHAPARARREGLGQLARGAETPAGPLDGARRGGPGAGAAPSARLWATISSSTPMAGAGALVVSAQAALPRGADVDPGHLLEEVLANTPRRGGIGPRATAPHR